MSASIIRSIAYIFRKSRLQNVFLRDLPHQSRPISALKCHLEPNTSAHINNTKRYYATENQSPKSTEENKEICKKTEVSKSQLCEMIKSKNIQLFDVRDAKEVEESGLIQPAINIPLNELKPALMMSEEEFLAKYKVPKPRQKDDNIIFYGFIEVKSSSAVQLAHNLGYKKARHFPAGWKSWNGLDK